MSIVALHKRWRSLKTWSCALKAASWTHTLVVALFEPKFPWQQVLKTVSHKQAVEKRSNHPQLNFPQLVHLFHFNPEHTQKLFLKIIATCLVLFRYRYLLLKASDAWNVISRTFEGSVKWNAHNRSSVTFCGL